MKDRYALVVIGAGPAGMAAAKLAASFALDVAVIDEQAQPGGQVYRQVDRSPLPASSGLGRDYDQGLPLVTAFRQAEIDYIANASVWYLDESGLIGLVVDGSSFVIQAQKVIIAVGAQERAMPLPGWQLPGVMTAGAGQILLKSAALVPDQPVVLAGSGPLLLLLATQYLNRGVKISAILDTTPGNNRLKAISHLPRALLAMDYLVKGVRMMMAIRRAGVPMFKQVQDLRAIGDDELEAVSFISADKSHRIDSSLLMLHQGVIPALHMAQAANCDINWSEAQQCWIPEVNEWGQSSQPNICIAGDAAGIVGVKAAIGGGKLVGLHMAFEFGKINRHERDRLAGPIRNSCQRHLAIRPFLEALYRVPEACMNPVDETIVCRCEEITAGQIRELAVPGCIGPNQAKAFTRCGMGPCQGRLCSNTITNIISSMRHQTAAETGCYKVRPPLKPITLGELATNEN